MPTQDDGKTDTPTAENAPPSIGGNGNSGFPYSLRQWYAGMAMQGMLSHPGTVADSFGDFGKELADHAMAYADALIAAEEAE